jgi:hypothetical protein
MLPPKERTISFFQYCRDLMLPNTNVSQHVPETYGYEAGTSKFFQQTFLAAVHKSPLSLQIRKDGKREDVTGDLPLSRVCRSTATRWVTTQIQKDDGHQIQSLDRHFFTPVWKNPDKTCKFTR